MFAGSTLNEETTKRLKAKVASVWEAWLAVQQWHSTPESYRAAVESFGASMGALNGFVGDVGTFPPRNMDERCPRCDCPPRYNFMNCPSCVFAEDETRS